MKIFLSGHVPKNDEEKKNFINWRLAYQKKLHKIFTSEYIDPFDRNLDETDPLYVVGSDCQHIKLCDLVIINAETQLGAGSAQEMVIAKYFRKPVVTVLPKNSFHRRSNITFNGQKIKDWIHPFINTFSDFIIASLNDLPSIKDKIFKAKIKDLTIIDQAINHINK